MSTRIIVEKDGERWELLSPDVKIINGDKIGSEDYLSFHYKFGGFQAVFLKRLPPVERTDNSEVIANLEAENAKLRDEIIKVIAARNELLDLNRDCCDENDKLREALNDVLTVAKNRIPTIPTVFECEAIGKAEEIVKGGAK